ncbi:MAG: hypothetical protein M1830_009080 [Pleopsidium flavum]|nr:MAG: hypothetical protein M1830_009080 [Pleopsidium flavum]
MDLSVLSAEHYDDRYYVAETRDATDRPNPTRYYGGIVMSDDADRTTNTVFGVVHSASEEDRPRKKSRKSSHGNEDNTSAKGRRGRPRLGPSDETAAERRRTQIRLAQRAYRLRKESTISSLTKRVSQLEGTLNEMNKTFLAFNDSAIASGITRIKPQLGQDLKQTTEHFLLLTRISIPDSDFEDERPESLKTHAIDSPDSSATRTRKRGKRDASSRTISLPAEAARPLTIGYEVIHDEEESTQPQANDHSQSTDRSLGGHADDQVTDVNWDTTIQQFRVGLPEVTEYMPSLSPTFDKLLHTPFTYSFQESTFARRLHRASIEKAYHILTNPNSWKGDISRIFRFCFFYADVNTITYRLREILKRSSIESLDNWASPFFHLGGAGTHYPRTDAEGNRILPPNMLAIGPRLWPETLQPKNATTEQLLTLTGWDGEWFDANDVEQYLRTEKGLRLDGLSTFEEMEVPLSPLPTTASHGLASPISSSTDSFTECQSSDNDPLPSPELGFQSHNYFNTTNGMFDQLDVPVTLHSGTSLSARESKLPDPLKYQSSHQSLTSHSLGSMVPQTTLTIDVSRLLRGNEILQGGVCLGRAPGYRRVDVDSALHMVMQEAF